MHARELVGVADGGLVPAGAGVLRAELIRTGVGARLACYRRLARLTQKEVAVRAGVSRELCPWWRVVSAAWVGRR